jgi:hypothetical protein
MDFLADIAIIILRRIKDEQPYNPSVESSLFAIPAAR